MKRKIRPKGSEPRSRTINIKVSPEEHERIKKAAEAVGLAMGTYLMSLAFPPSKSAEK